MNPGKLDRRITLQSRTDTRGTSGSAVESWSDLPTISAERVKTDAREFRAAAARHAEITELFRIRYRAGITSGGNRVVFEGRSHDILGIIEEGRRESQLVSCRYTEGAP